MIQMSILHFGNVRCAGERDFIEAIAAVNDHHVNRTKLGQHARENVRKPPVVNANQLPRRAGGIRSAAHLYAGLYVPVAVWE